MLQAKLRQELHTLFSVIIPREINRHIPIQEREQFLRFLCVFRPVRKAVGTIWIEVVDKMNEVVRKLTTFKEYIECGNTVHLESKKLCQHYHSQEQ
jgi:hypothetical protein